MASVVIKLSGVHTWEDVKPKLPRDLATTAIKDLHLNSDGSTILIQGTVMERSSLHKTKRFDYMRFSLKDGDEDNSCICVFAAGTITEELDKLEKGFHVVIHNFLIEANTRTQTYIHPCQVVLDEDFTAPQVWYFEMETSNIETNKASTSNIETNKASTSTNNPSTTSKIADNSNKNLGSSEISDDTATTSTRALKSEISKKKSPSKPVVYTDIANLKVSTTVNVFGVVKFTKPPYKTRGSDYSMMVTLVDHSFHGVDKKLKCLLFHREADKLPKVSVGNIIRFHRLKVGKFAGDLQGQSGPGWSWLYVTPDSSDPVVSSANYTYTEQDMAKIEELRQWSKTQEELCNGNKSGMIEDIVPGLYLDLVCQVVSTCIIEEGVCYLLKVWDGTKTLYPVREMSEDGQQHKSDGDLQCRAKDWMVDVALYDDHYKLGSTIKPGQYIRLCNLHAAKYNKNPAVKQDLSSLPMVELVLHRGTSYGRGVLVLADEVPVVKNLKNRLDKISPPVAKLISSQDAEDIFAESFGLSGNTEDTCSSKNTDNGNGSFVTRQKSLKRNLDESEYELESCSSKKKRLSTDQPSLDVTCEDITSDYQTPDNIDRCMLQTSTVILNHPHIKRSMVKEVLDHSIPYKFRILGHVKDYFPKPSCPEDLITMYCDKCNSIEPLPIHDNNAWTENSLVIDSKRDGVKYYRCRNCPAENNNDEVTVLEYTYMVRFLLCDSSGWLIANLWKSDAVTFFRDIHPTDLIKDTKTFREVRDSLQRLCPSTEKPYIECCVKSYSVEEGSGYQIFDTCLV